MRTVGNCTICGNGLNPEATFSYVRNVEGTGFVCFKHTCRNDPNEIKFEYAI